MNFNSAARRYARPQPRMLLGGSGDPEDVDAMIDAKFAKLRVFKSDKCPKSQEWNEFSKSLTYEDEGGNMVCVDGADGMQLSKAHQLIMEDYKYHYTNLQKKRREVNECEQKARDAEAAASAGAAEEAERKYQELLKRVAGIEADLAACNNKTKLAMDALSGGRRTRAQIIDRETDGFLGELLPSEKPATGRRQPCRGIERTYQIGSVYGANGYCVYEESARLLRLSVARARPHFRELYEELYKEGGLIDRLQACKEQAGNSVSGGDNDQDRANLVGLSIAGGIIVVAAIAYGYDSYSKRT